MFMAPANTPKDIVDKLGAEVAKAVKDEALRKRLAEQAVIPVGATPAETAKFLNDEGREVAEGDHHRRREDRGLETFPFTGKRRTFTKQAAPSRGRRRRGARAARSLPSTKA